MVNYLKKSWKLTPNFSDRVLVENFFGRLKTTFGILSTPYRCALNSLEDVVITCICLLNAKLKTHPLRAINGDEHGGADNGDIWI